MLKNASEIKASTKNLDVGTFIAENEPSTMHSTETTTLDQLPELQLFRKVMVYVKAILVNDPVQLNDKLKQDIIVADATGTARLTVWEDHCNSLQQGRSYHLKNYVVRVFQAVKYLSRGEGSQLLAIEDIGHVAAEVEEDQEITYKHVTIIGVPQLDSYKSCLKCKARVEPSTYPLGSCSNKDCKMNQRIDFCPKYTSAKIMILHTPVADGQNKIAQVYVHGREMLLQFASCRGDHNATEITQDLLLRAPALMWITVMKNNRIVKACSSASEMELDPRAITD